MDNTILSQRAVSALFSVIYFIGILNPGCKPFSRYYIYDFGPSALYLQEVLMFTEYSFCASHCMCQLFIPCNSSIVILIDFTDDKTETSTVWVTCQTYRTCKWFSLEFSPDLSVSKPQILALKGRKTKW